ncbi:hypothetical protein LTR85_008253 [Meristemomyces frigidus]|nr:hypothetical protein LTR85_008253 [Meristemomyces frigidus]
MLFPTLFTLALAATAAQAATKYTTTTTSYAVKTLPTSNCGAFSTVAANYAHCSAGCHPVQLPGALNKPEPNSPYVCSDPADVVTKKTTKTKTVTCHSGSTVREMTPAFGSVWPKCTN